MTDRQLRPHKCPFDIEKDLPESLERDGISGKRAILFRLHLEKLSCKGTRPLTFASYNAVKTMLSMAYDEPKHKDNIWFDPIRNVSERMFRENEKKILERIFGGVDFDDTVINVR